MPAVSNSIWGYAVQKQVWQKLTNEIWKKLTKGYNIIENCQKKLIYKNTNSCINYYIYKFPPGGLDEGIILKPKNYPSQQKIMR